MTKVTRGTSGNVRKRSTTGSNISMKVVYWPVRFVTKCRSAMYVGPKLVRGTVLATQILKSRAVKETQSRKRRR